MLGMEACLLVGRQTGVRGRQAGSGRSAGWLGSLALSNQPRRLFWMLTALPPLPCSWSQHIFVDPTHPRDSYRLTFNCVGELRFSCSLAGERSRCLPCSHPILRSSHNPALHPSHNPPTACMPARFHRVCPPHRASHPRRRSGRQPAQLQRWLSHCAPPERPPALERAAGALC